jgi:ATP-dependent exoDNAse (exonuclease V) alpha subunit
LKLFLDNESVKNKNKEALTELKMPIVPIIAKNTPSSARNVDDENFYGLTNDLFLCINSKIVLTTNEWTEMGLVNGAPGVIKDIIYPNTMNNLFETHPIAILIEFDKYNGPRIFEDEEKKNWIPINSKSAYNKFFNSSRNQFPIRLNYATTIHKSQGSTLNRGVIDLGTSEKTLGLTFVALSRFKNINDFIIKPFPYSRLEKIKQSKSLAPRLEEEKRIQLIVESTLKNFDFLLPVN